MISANYKRSRRRVLQVLGLLGVAAAANIAATADAQTVIKLGAFAPETGPNSVVYPIVLSTSAFFKALNDRGGINGYKFEYIVVDDQFNPSLTVSAVRRLVEQENVFALVGPVGTPSTLATKSYLEEKQIPVIAPSTGAPNAAGPYHFLMQHDAVNEGAFQAEFAVTKLGAAKGKLAALYQNDDIGKPFLKGIQYQMDQKKVGDPVAVPFQSSTIDFTPAVARLQQSGVDVVIISSVPQSFAPIIKAAEAIAFRPKWIGVSYHASPAILSQLPEAQVANMYFAFWSAPPNGPEAESMRQALAKYYPATPPSSLTVQGWIPGVIFEEAFKRMTANGGKPTREGLVAALKTFKGFTSPYIRNISYAPAEGVTAPHLPRPDEAMMQWKGGKLEPVSPFQQVPKVAGQPGQ